MLEIISNVDSMRNLSISIILIIVAILFISMCLRIEFIQDDAYITFRYVKNFLNGYGLVFNYGEYVEGYTTFLWLIILSALGWVGIDYVNASHVISITFGALSLIITFFIARQIKPIDYTSKFINELFNLLPVILLLCTGGFQYWSVSGMETSLFVFLVLLSIYLYQRSIQSGKPDLTHHLVLLLAALTRPEGLFIWILITIHNVYLNFGLMKQIEFRKKFVKHALYFLIPFSVYFLFRLIYYGYPVPNTFYAKTGYGSFYLYRGIVYVFETLNDYFLYGVFLIVPLFLLRVDSIKKYFHFLYYIVLSYIAAIIIIGGDVLPMHRFMLPVIPLVYVMFAKFYQATIQKFLGHSFYKLHAAILVFAVTAAFAYQNYKSELPLIYEKRAYETGLVTKMKIYSEFLNNVSEESNEYPTVSLSTIGAFSYYTSARVIDLIGLTDEYIAHNPKEEPGIDESIPLAWKERRYNIDYVLEQKPDYIIFPAGAKPSAYPEAALFSRKEFHDMYYPQIFFSYELNQYLPVFTLREKSANPVYSDEQDSVQCKTEFLTNYILANNYFLSYLETHDSSYIKKSLNESFKMIENCIARKSEAYTTIGYTYFHIGMLEKSKKFLEAAVEADSMNCLALLYLSNNYAKTGDAEKYVKTLKKLKVYSPYAIPYFLNED